MKTINIFFGLVIFMLTSCHMDAHYAHKRIPHETISENTKQPANKIEKDSIIFLHPSTENIVLKTEDEATKGTDRLFPEKKDQMTKGNKQTLHRMTLDQQKEIISAPSKIIPNAIITTKIKSNYSDDKDNFVWFWVLFWLFLVGLGVLVGFLAHSVLLGILLPVGLLILLTAVFIVLYVI